jgi:hypothetical protein
VRELGALNIEEYLEKGCILRRHQAAFILGRTCKRALSKFPPFMFRYSEDFIILKAIIINMAITLIRAP